MNIKDLTERDICSKFINPALEKAGWDLQTQIREEVSLTAGRIIVRGKLHTRAVTQFKIRKNFASSRLRVSPSGGAKT